MASTDADDTPLKLTADRIKANGFDLNWQRHPTDKTDEDEKESKANYSLEAKKSSEDDSHWKEIYSGNYPRHDGDGLDAVTEYDLRIHYTLTNADGSEVKEDVVGPVSTFKTIIVPVNGGTSTEHYSWTQDQSDVDLSCKLPIKVRARDIICDMKQASLKVALKGHDPIIDGELANHIVVDESTWSLEDEGTTLTIHLEKRYKGGFWTCLLKGGDLIDCNMIEPPTVSMQELDPEAQQLVSKMKHDQWAKATGNPTSEQLEQQNMLKKLQSEHPEFDFSKAKISGSGMGGLS